MNIQIHVHCLHVYKHMPSLVFENAIVWSILTILWSVYQYYGKCGWCRFEVTRWSMVAIKLD